MVGDMGSEGAQRSPAEVWAELLFARPGAYGVVGRTSWGDRVGFETADPAEAVAAGLVQSPWANSATVTRSSDWTSRANCMS